MRKLLVACLGVGLLAACGDADTPGGEAGVPREDAGDSVLDAALDTALDEEPDAASEVASPQAGTGAGSQAVDPLQCHVLCSAVDAAGCSAAPSHDACVQLCERAIARCPALVLELFDCGGPVPAFACDADGLLISQPCPTELIGLQECAAAGDAG